MGRRGLPIVAVAVAALLLPAAAGAQGDAPDAGPRAATEAGAAGDATAQARKPARLRVRVKRAGNGRLPVRAKARIVGRLAPFVRGRKVQLRLMRGGKLVKRRNVNVRPRDGGRYGVFRLASGRLTKPGRYRVLALKRRSAEQDLARDRSKPFRLKFPRLSRGSRGPRVALFNRLLRQRGYHVPASRYFGAATARAVLAYRKVNWMSRNRRATRGIFSKLAAGNGGFKLRRPGAGRHVEVDLARQVMVLAANGKPQHTFHISSGKPSTPSDRGHFRFFYRQPGYNSVGMYYSVYYNGGEATHGYKSVPTYPASNGCIRNPTPDSRFIYNWVRLGMSIYVY